MTTDILDAICIYILIITLCKLNLPMKESRAFKKMFSMADIEKIEVFDARTVSHLFYSSFASVEV